MDTTLSLIPLSAQKLAVDCCKAFLLSTAIAIILTLFCHICFWAGSFLGGAAQVTDGLAVLLAALVLFVTALLLANGLQRWYLTMGELGGFWFTEHCLSWGKRGKGRKENSFRKHK